MPSDAKYDRPRTSSYTSERQDVGAAVFARTTRAASPPPVTSLVHPTSTIATVTQPPRCITTKLRWRRTPRYPVQILHWSDRMLSVRATVSVALLALSVSCVDPGEMSGNRTAG